MVSVLAGKFRDPHSDVFYFRISLVTQFLRHSDTVRHLMFFARFPTKNWQPLRTGVDRRLSPHDSVKGTEVQGTTLSIILFSARLQDTARYWEILYCEMLVNYLGS